MLNKKTSRMGREAMFFMAFCLSSFIFLLGSCSESDNTVEEFPDWKNTNVNYWDKLYAETQAKVTAGDASWKAFKSYSIEDSLAIAQHRLHHSQRAHGRQGLRMPYLFRLGARALHGPAPALHIIPSGLCLRHDQQERSHRRHGWRCRHEDERPHGKALPPRCNACTLATNGMYTYHGHWPMANRVAVRYPDTLC